MSANLKGGGYDLMFKPPAGPIAKKWTMFLTLGEPGWPRRHVEALFGGSVGAGKTRAMVAWLLLRAINYPGIRLALVRDTLKNLKRSSLKSLYEAANGRIARSKDEYNRVEHIAYYLARDEVIVFKNGSEIHLFGVKDADAADRLVGTEWGGVGVDQLERIPKDIYVQIVPRMRQDVRHAETGEVVWPMVKSTANLTEKRTSWVARRFVFEAPTTPLSRGQLAEDVREMYVESEIDGQRVSGYRAYFRARYGENKSVNEHYSSVLAVVASDIGGFLTDEWQDDLEQVFLYEWDGSLLTDPPQGNLDAYDLIVGMDWGWGASPTTAVMVLWHRTKGYAIVDREYIEYGRDASDYANEIALDLLEYAKRGVRNIRIYPDPTMWNRTGMGKTAADVFFQVFRKRVGGHARIMMVPAFKRGTLALRSKERVDPAKRFMRQRTLLFSNAMVPKTVEVVSSVVWGDIFKDRHPVTDIFDAFIYATLNLPDAPVEEEEDLSAEPEPMMVWWGEEDDYANQGLPDGIRV